MASECRRVFVGNLPHEVTRNDVVEKFKNYGNVESVEIKTKRDTSTDQVLSTFCYVNLKTDNHTLDSCIQLLNGIKWDGRHIKVEVAKESFLQRLQRERQSTPQTSSKSNASHSPTKNTDIDLKVVERKTKDAAKKLEKKQVSRPSESSENEAENASFKFNDKVKRKDSQGKIKKPVVNKPASSSESSSSEDETVTYHPTSKLPMFRGIASFLSDNVTQQEGRNGNSSKETISIKKPFLSRSNLEDTHMYSNTSSDVLKKFESFSDVWKDADEQSHQRQPSGRHCAIPVGWNHGHEAHSIDKQNSYNKTVLENYSFQSYSKKGAMQEVCVTANPLSNIAEEKRLKSLEAKRQAFEEQKKAVQLALSDKTAPKMNKKIVFGDDNIVENDLTSIPKQKQKRNEGSENLVKGHKTKPLKLFDESDDESVAEKWDGEFHVKKQFEGEKGRKLLELQTRYNNDNRFKLDERFYESDDEDKAKNSTNGDSLIPKPSEGIEGLAEEREQQLQILSSVLGRPIPTSQPPTQQMNKTKGMLRFDPLKPQHSRYVITKEPEEKKKKKRVKSADPDKEREEEDEDEEDTIKSKVRREEKEPEPVSQNKFYSVSNSLSESLKLAKEGQASGFSLLQMFGSSHIPPEKKYEPKEVTQKEKVKSRLLVTNSSSEDEESDNEGPTANVKNSAPSASIPANSTVKTAGGVWQESFFFLPNDNRLKEGAQFFSQIEDPSNSTNFFKKRQALRHIVKSKLRNSSRKANSFKTKVGALRKKTMWQSSQNRVQKQRRKPRF